MSDRVLVVVAHPDDETFLCGGAIARHIEQGDSVDVMLLTDGETSRLVKAALSNTEKRFDALRGAMKALGPLRTWIGVRGDQRLDTYPILEITRDIEERVAEVRPHIVYTHWQGDLNEDHRIVCQAVKVACRPQSGKLMKIVMGEVPSSSEWGGGFTPNAFFSLTEGQWAKKMAALQCYADELRDWPHARSLKAIEALMQHRAATVGVEYCEAFVIERMVS